MVRYVKILGPNFKHIQALAVYIKIMLFTIQQLFFLEVEVDCNRR